MPKDKKPLNKTEFLSAIADRSGISKKEVGSVFDAMEEVIRDQLAKGGVGAVTLPGIAKITVVEKPAKEAGTKPNPFKPGEMMEVKAKPATRVVKVRPLKGLKDMV